MIDTSDIREMTAEDFARGRRNPYAENLRKNGYSIIINVSPEDIVKKTKDNIEKIQRMDMLELDPDERKALEKYMEKNASNTSNTSNT